MEGFLPILIALVVIAIAWKLLAGTLRTVVLVAILVAAALFVFGANG